MNIGLFLTRWARLSPDRPALIHGSRMLTWRQFNNRTNRLANALHRLGLRRGDNVSILQYNYPETLESLFACFKAGLGAVPINFRLHPREFAHIIDDSQSKAVILSHEFEGSILDVKEFIPGARHLITLSNNKELPLMKYEELLSIESDTFEERETNPEDVAWLFYTSGTTGRPKGAMLTHRNLMAMILTYYADYGHLNSRDAILHAAPLSHGSGLYALPHIARGSTNIILDSRSFDPERVFWTIEKHRITNMFAAPTMVKLLVESPVLERCDIHSLKSLIYGGGPMHVADLRRAIEVLGPCLTQLYGMGETPMTISYLPHEDHTLGNSPEELKRLSSAGIPRTGVEVKIFDPDGREVPVGEKGEVVTRSDVVMKGYWQNPKATREAIRRGWLHTGDVGYLDTAGYLYLMDRTKDMIISGGENIYPREVEEVLIQHPAVREVAVIGIPDVKWGESVKAVVSLKSGRTAEEEELVAFCRDRIAGYKRPKSIDFMPELPKNNYGKTLKRELRAKYWGDRDRKI